MVEPGGTTQRLARALAGVALVLAVSGCTGASPSATGSSRAPAPSATSRASWTATGGMIEARSHHTATLLPDGSVLVAGGQSWSGFDYPLLASAELYDAASGSWSVIGEMTEARGDHTATLLPDGKVLVAGGYGDGYLASAELYDPITRSWIATGSMDGPRYDHTATLLPDGKVLVTGGAIGGGDTEVTLASVEVYDPSTASWTAAQEMNAVRYRHTATLLLDGTVLVAGGIGPDLLASAELYDPGSGSWTTTGSMNGVPWEHAATLLLDGTVLVTGGCCSVADATAALASAELYDPAKGSWTATDSMNGARAGHTVTRLPDGWVLMVGGDGPQAFAELYDPGSRSWTATAEMIEGRGGHTATLLVDGRMLVAGGFGRSSSVLASAELFDPGSGS